ncbi:hypothetical protein L7F22_038975 [Adiantum nelumboides]|nr:hypothetical protein [Adiantum nelumboides]
MAKKNLKNAFRAHEAKKTQALKEEKVKEAAQRKAISIKNGAGTNKKKKNEAVSNGKEAKEQNKHVINSSTEKVKRPRINMFQQNETILLVGEGNFSFTKSLLQPPHNHSPSHIVATAFDNEKQCYQKYPDAENNVKEIRSIAGREDIVLFGVDAGNLLAHKGLQKVTKSIKSNTSPASWNKIVFNFPHVGAGHKDESRNVLANQLLLIRFLISAAPLLNSGQPPIYVQKQLGKPQTQKRKRDNEEQDEDDEFEFEAISDNELDFSDTNEEIPNSVQPTIVRPLPHAGSILITLRDCKPYTLWDVATLAKRISSIWQTIIQSAPSPGKGIRMPSREDIDVIAKIIELSNSHTSKTTKKNSEGRKGYLIWQSFAFDPKDWPGYAHRRTIGWKEGVSKAENEEILRGNHVDEQRASCRTWQFGLAG